jgi:hypothetical protein
VHITLRAERAAVNTDSFARVSVSDVDAALSLLLASYIMTSK